MSDSLPEFTIGEPCCPHARLHGHTEYLHEKYDLAAWCTNCVPLDECLCYYLKDPSGEIWVSVRTVCRPGCPSSPVSPLLKCSFGRLLNCSVTPARPHCHGITLQHRIYSHICSSNFSLLILSNLHSLFFLHYLQCLFSAPKLFIIIWWHGGQPAPAQWWMVTPRGQWGHPPPPPPLPPLPHMCWAHFV